MHKQKHKFTEKAYSKLQIDTRTRTNVHTYIQKTFYMIYWPTLRWHLTVKYRRPHAKIVYHFFNPVNIFL